MSSRLRDIDVQRAYTLLQRQADQLELESDDWSLVQPDESHAPRQPWTVTGSNGHVLLHLGYTKRDAFDAMSHMTAILTLVNQS